MTAKNVRNKPSQGQKCQNFRTLLDSGQFFDIFVLTKRKNQENLRVVQTQAVLFLKSMSERRGSDI